MGDFLAYELLPVILNMTVTASVVIVLVLLARRALRRAPRICSYALWLVVLFRLLCPVSLTAGISLMGLLDTPVTEVTAHTSAAAYVPRDVVHNPEPSVTLPVPGAGEAITEALPRGEEQTVADPLEAPIAIATIVWLTGTAAMVLYGAVSLLRLRRRLVGAVPLEKGVYLVDHISTPFVLGLFRPKIYLPSALPEGERGYILLHERHHIRRLDHVVKLLAFLSLCIHWFNPLVWLMFVLLGRDMEMSCDEAVMKKLGEAVRADYSASLLRLATGRHFPAGVPLAFGEGDTRERVKNVLRWKEPRLWAVLAGAAVCTVVIAACAVNPSAQRNGEYASVEDSPVSVEISLAEGNSFSPEKAGVYLDGDGREVTTADIAQTLAAQTLPDGTEVLFYTATSGDKYCAYIPVGTERLIRFTEESNVYTDGYDISLYENVLGTSGFRIECPRGAAYYANDYYYFDEEGILWLLAACGSQALEVDLNGDGQEELLWSYHGYELYYDTLIDGQLYEVDLCALTAQALGYQWGSHVQVALDVPVRTEDFVDGETSYTIILPEEGNDTPEERLAGIIRLTADTLEVFPDIG